MYAKSNFKHAKVIEQDKHTYPKKAKQLQKKPTPKIFR